MSNGIKGRDENQIFRDVKVNADGELLVSAGSGGSTSDTTAANQATQIAEAQEANTTLETIKDAETVNVDWDYYDISYVAAGNGVGEIETVTYFTGAVGAGTQVLSLTFTYDASSNITRVVRAA